LSFEGVYHHSQPGWAILGTIKDLMSNLPPPQASATEGTDFKSAKDSSIMNCEELQLKLKKLKQRRIDLEDAYSSMGSYLGSIADRPSMDSTYDRVSESQDEVQEELEVLRGEIEELENLLREQGCPSEI
jgi:chromosome segregation ATPase